MVKSLPMAVSEIHSSQEAELAAYREAANLYRQYEIQSRASVTILSALTVGAISIIDRIDDPTLQLAMGGFMLLVSLLIVNVQYRLLQLQKLYYVVAVDLERKLSVAVFRQWTPPRFVLPLSNTTALMVLVVMIALIWFAFPMWIYWSRSI